MAKRKPQNELGRLPEPIPFPAPMPMPTPNPMPMLKTAEQMSKVCGIGEGRLRELMDRREIEYVQNGNRRLIADAAIWEWYDRNKTCVGMGVGG